VVDLALGARRSGPHGEAEEANSDATFFALHHAILKIQRKNLKALEMNGYGC
jgi:hypothetical protein